MSAWRVELDEELLEKIMSEVSKEFSHKLYTFIDEGIPWVREALEKKKTECILDWLDDGHRDYLYEVLRRMDII